MLFFINFDEYVHTNIEIKGKLVLMHFSCKFA